MDNLTQKILNENEVENENEKENNSNENILKQNNESNIEDNLKQKKLSAIDVLKNSLIKKAQGFMVEEVTKEFVKEDDKLVLHKKKVSTKEFPPDSTAIKFLLELEKFNTNEFSLLSDEQLKQEKDRLLNLLKEEENGN
ncbi:MAG: hypothetical protein IJW32_03805 [Clostridia bacterium]|nr:hypothetical protein [Clostridia bacterium]